MKDFCAISCLPSLASVIGSHRLSPLGISANMLFDWDGSGQKGQTVFAGNDVGRTVADGYAPMGSMPNCVKFAAKAGDCCIFDLATCVYL